MERGKGQLYAYLTIAPSFAFILFLTVIPVAGALLATFRNSAGKWTLVVYSAMFRTPGMLADIWFTVEVTIVSCFVVMLISVVLSVYLRFNQGILVRLLENLYYLPIFIPSVIASYGIRTVYEQHGLLNLLLVNLGIHAYPHIIYTGIAIVIAQIWFHVPFTTLILLAALQGIPYGMIESARDIGASQFIILVRIILPQIRYVGLFAFTLVFLGCFGGYTVPYILGPNSPQMLGVVVSQTMIDYLDIKQASAISVVMFFLCSFVALFYVRNIMARQRS